MRAFWQRVKTIGEWIADRIILPVIIALFPNGTGSPGNGESDGKE